MNEITNAHCNTCHGIRRHAVLHKEDNTWEDQLADINDPDQIEAIYGGDVYELLKCCGCGGISFRHTEYYPGETAANGTPVKHEDSYPKPASRPKPSWTKGLMWAAKYRDNFIGEILDEIYTALNNNAPRLATMGIRALIEHIMIDKVGDNGKFKDNLKKFKAQGFLSDNDHDTIKRTIDVGHAAMHRNYCPPSSDLQIILDVTENLIEPIYINPKKTIMITDRVPPRESTKRDK